MLEYLPFSSLDIATITTTLKNFLAFNTFISNKILIIFYYFFALMLPIIIYKSRKAVEKRLPFLQNYKRLTITLTLLGVLLFMELFLRMAFELMIAYFDMHDYLSAIRREMG